MKAFTLRIESELHFALKLAALKKDISMHEFIVQAIREKLDKEAEK